MSKGRVLIVDDSRLVREWSANVLRTNGMEVDVRRTGKECCDDVVDVSPDVIIMDLEMPEVDGMSAIRQLRNRKETLHIPILVFASQTSLDTKIAALEAGANDFLSKNADEAELVARVKSLLRVTELENDLISERNKLSCILNDLADPVVIVDLKGQLILVNEAGSRLLRIQSHQFNQGAVADFVGHLEGSEDLLAALESEESRDIEVRLVTEERVFTYRVIVTTVYQSHKLTLGKAMLFHDMTRENEIQQMKADFMSMIAHDLRSPISVITGYTGLLLSGKAGDLNETQLEFLDGVQGRAKTMLKLVDEFLTVSEFESSFLKLDLKPVDVCAVLRNSIKALSVIAVTKSISLNFEDGGRVAQVMGDEDKLYKVFTNLIDNALKYTPDGGRIAAYVTSTDGVVQIEVHDSGIGISEEELEYIFDRYKRAASATTRKIKGTGLGLTIVSEIVNAHHGEVWATSNDGDGSQFYVVLPAAKKNVKVPTELADIKS